MKKPKTIKDILVQDAELSGPLTPENGESYNETLGEPKFYQAYKATEYELHKFAKEQIKYLEKQRPYGYNNIINWIKHTFNLEKKK